MVKLDLDEEEAKELANYLDGTDMHMGVHDRTQVARRIRDSLPKPRVPNKCARCEVTDDDDYLVDITVTVNKDEEGFDFKTLYFCDQHFGSMQKLLTDAGFFTHHHGSTDLLEDYDCPGSSHQWPHKGECPTPEPRPYERMEFGD